MSNTTSKKTTNKRTQKKADSDTSVKPTSGEVSKPAQGKVLNNAESLDKNQSVHAEPRVTDKKTIVDKEPSANKEKPSTKEELSPDKKPLASKGSTASPTINNKKTTANQADSNNKKSPVHETIGKTESKANKTKTTGTETVQPNTKKQGSGLSLFAIFLSLSALGVSGYHYYDNKIKTLESNNQLGVDISQIGGQVSRISDSFARLQADQANIVTQDQLSNKVTQANSNFGKKVSDLTAQQTQLSESVSTINEELRKGANQYVLDEVSQLLRLGNNSAIFTGDAASAVNAFTLADIQLKELNNPRYSVVRRKINEEIQLLKSIKQIDTESVLAQLSAISNKVPSLPLENEPPVSDPIDKTSNTNDKEPITFRSEIRKMWSDVINSVSIQRVDQPPKPLLAPKERYFLNQNLQLQLVKAEIALLQNRQTLYKSSLKEASSWLNGYFDLDNKEVSSILKQLKSLQNQTLATELPSVSGSYDLLQTIKGGQ